MSEATKACPNIRCQYGRIVEVGACEYVGDTDMGECPDCSGTGRVPDEVATLRAQLDAARAEVERLLLVGREHDLRHAANSLTITDAYSRACADNDRLRAEVERLTALYRKADDGHDENMRETARLIREVDRLTAREREAARILSVVSTAHASAWSAEAEAWPNTQTQ